MNKFRVLMALALIAASGYCAQAAVPAQNQEVMAQAASQAQVAIETGWAVIPSSKSPHYASALDKLMVWLKTGVLPSGDPANDPSVPLIMPSRLYPEYLMESSTARLWFGIVNPTNPALAEERGNILVFWAKFESQQGLRLSDVQATLQSNDSYIGVPQNSLGLVQRMNTIDYSTRAEGLVWKDGVKGRAGATPVISGPATQVVNQLLFTGIAKDYTGDTVVEIDGIRSYFYGQPKPFTMTGRYDVLNGTTSIASGVKQLSLATHTLAIKKYGQQAFEVTVIGDPGVSFTIQRSSSPAGPWADCAILMGGDTIRMAASGLTEYFKAMAR